MDFFFTKNFQFPVTETSKCLMEKWRVELYGEIAVIETQKARHSHVRQLSYHQPEQMPRFAAKRESLVKHVLSFNVVGDGIDLTERPLRICLT